MLTADRHVTARDRGTADETRFTTHVVSAREPGGWLARDPARPGASLDGQLDVDLGAARRDGLAVGPSRLRGAAVP
jgi:hypothetical protein